MAGEHRFRTEACTGVLGAVVLAAAAVALLLAPAPIAAGDVPVPVAASETPPGSAATPGVPEPTQDVSTTAADAGDADGDTGLAVVAPMSAPTGLSLPSLDVDAPIDEVGLLDDGAMEVPDDVHELGWYGLGPMPGEPGSAVIAGHVDGSGQGPGAFWDLHALAVDDAVVVDHADGTTSSWRVTARRAYGKDELPMDELFTRDGPPRLTLITCGGAFDPTSRSYEENIVVHAVPITEPADTAG